MLVDDSAVVIDAQKLAEFADELVIDRQPDRPVAIQKRRTLDQRADIRERRSDQPLCLIPGIPVVDGELIRGALLWNEMEGILRNASLFHWRT